MFNGQTLHTFHATFMELETTQHEKKIQRLTSKYDGCDRIRVTKFLLRETLSRLYHHPQHG